MEIKILIPLPPSNLYLYLDILFFFFLSILSHTLKKNESTPYCSVDKYSDRGGGERSEKFIVHSWNDVYIPLNRVFNTRDRICLTKGPIIDPFSSPTPFPPPLHFSRRSREPETEIRPQSRLRNRSKSR